MHENKGREIMKKRWIGLLACLAFGQTQAASFDCAKAGTKVEKLICADQKLSKQDDDLKSAYQAVYTLTADRAALKWAQRDWLKARNACKDTACVKQAYQTRQAELEKTKAEPKPCFRLLERKWPEVQSGHYPVCLAYLKNLNRFCGEPPPTCERKLDPAIKELSLPKWEEIDPKAHLKVIEQTLNYNFENIKVWLPIPPDMLEHIHSRKVHMLHTWVDLDHDGKMEHVVRFDDGPCHPINPSGERGFYGFNYEIAVVDKDITQVDERFRYVEIGGRDVLLYEGRAYLWHFTASDGPDTFSLQEPFHVSVTDTGNADSVCVFQYLK